MISAQKFWHGPVGMSTSTLMDLARPGDGAKIFAWVGRKSGLKLSGRVGAEIPSKISRKFPFDSEGPQMPSHSSLREKGSIPHDLPRNGFSGLSRSSEWQEKAIAPSAGEGGGIHPQLIRRQFRMEWIRTSEPLSPWRYSNEMRREGGREEVPSPSETENVRRHHHSGC